MKFVIQFVKFAIVVGLIACGVFFSTHNQNVYSYWLFGQTVDLPSWQPVIGGFLLGAALSCFFFAVDTIRGHMELWRLKRKLKRFEPLENDDSERENLTDLQSETTQPYTAESQ